MARTPLDPTLSAHYVGDCRKLLRRLPDQCVQTCITSPPYWGLRDYGEKGQFGLEPTPAKYVRALVRVFDEVWRVLRDDGTLWLNLGDCYANGKVGRSDEDELSLRRRNQHYGTAKAPKTGARGAASGATRRARGLKPKDLVGIPWMVAFALRDAGWYLRMDNIWSKPNPMPESVTDRTTKSHEYLFHLSKSASYYYNADAIRDGLRNKRSVWEVTPTPYKGAHFATFPPALIEPCVLACSRPGDLVLDPFFGTGTTGEVAEKHERRWIGFDINPRYAELAKERTAQRSLPLAIGDD